MCQKRRRMILMKCGESFLVFLVDYTCIQACPNKESMKIIPGVKSSLRVSGAIGYSIT